MLYKDTKNTKKEAKKMNTYYEYLFSTAYIENAVSKLLETQAKKISVLSEKGLPAEQIGALNKTLRDQLKKLEYLHLLLYNKTALLLNALENSEAAEASPTRGGDTHKNACGYILNCVDRNAVGNPHDPYGGGFSVLDTYAFIPNAKTGSFLAYNVVKGSKMLDLFSLSADMQPEISFEAGRVRAQIKGFGMAMIRENKKHDFQTCGYIFEVISDDMSFLRAAYSIKIFLAENGILLHDSGTAECTAGLAKV